MSEKIKQMLTTETDVGSIGFLVVVAIVAVIVFFLFYITAKASFDVEKISGRPSYTLIKTIIIAAFPTVCGVLELLKVDVNISNKIIITVCVIACILVAVWNFITYGPIGGIMFTIVHVVFGAIASVGVLSLVFIIVFVIVIALFGGGATDSYSGNSSAPSTLRDVNTGERYHVTKGVNGELYIDSNGRSSILRASDYSGRYFDDYGNEYIV